MIPRFVVALPAVALLSLALAAPAAAVIGPWVEADNVRGRLISAGPRDGGGDIPAVLELELAPGWKTYWRTPGEAGIPPVFDFSASKNLADVEIAYPPPMRIEEAGSTVNVYEGRVLLPLRITAETGGRPVALDLSLKFGVCNEICIPVVLDAALEMPPHADPEAASIVADGLKRLPHPPLADIFALTGAVRTGGDDNAPEYELRGVVPQPSDVELFVEGPAGWYAEVPSVAAREGREVVWRVTFDRLGSKVPPELAEFRATVVSGDRAMEQTIKPQ